jgi:hypothetical protein
MVNCRARSYGGVMLLGEANREAPAQAELRPTCAGPAMSKCQRVEWDSGFSLHPFLWLSGTFFPFSNSNFPTGTGKRIC